MASPEREAVERALQPVIALSALAASALMTLVGLLFFVPLWLAEGRAWTGAGLGGALWVLAPVAFLLVYGASKQGIRRQLRPLADVGEEVLRRLRPGGPCARGRLRGGWGVALEFPLREGEPLRVVAARGQRVRPELYLVRGEREYHFREVKRPLPELDEALRAVGL